MQNPSSGEEGLAGMTSNPTIFDTEGTIEKARRLWKACDRPNVMVKIPGTAQGLPAIRQCLAEGVNVNITLLFSVRRYLEVVDAWFAAFEERVERGDPVDRLASVASFFVSRVDAKVDDRLSSRRSASPTRRSPTSGSKSASGRRDSRPWSEPARGSSARSGHRPRPRVQSSRTSTTSTI